MATDWYEVKKILQKHCPNYITTLKGVLHHLYVEKQLSLHAIAELTDREVLSDYPIRDKLKELEIPLKRRGGVHNLKTNMITPQEMREVPKRKLARKYGVHVSTLYLKERKMKEEECKTKQS